MDKKLWEPSSAILEAKKQALHGFPLRFDRWVVISSHLIVMKLVLTTNQKNWSRL